MRCRIGTARRALLRRYCRGALRSVQVGVRLGSVGSRTARLNPQKLWITKWISPYKVRSTSLASGLRSDCSKIAQPAPAFPVVSARMRNSNSNGVGRLCRAASGCGPRAAYARLRVPGSYGPRAGARGLVRRWAGPKQRERCPAIWPRAGEAVGTPVFRPCQLELCGHFLAGHREPPKRCPRSAAPTCESAIPTPLLHPLSG